MACDTFEPYAVRDVVYKSLINLLVDICKRNGIKKLLWKADKSLIGQVNKQNMTVHRWFANKSCPGEWLYSRHGQIANLVNERLGTTIAVNTPVSNGSSFLVKVMAGALNVRSGPGTSNKINTCVKRGDVYTIVETYGDWGRLKSGAGWINLGFTERV